jgi:hypothetical protein
VRDNDTKKHARYSYQFFHAAATSDASLALRPIDVMTFCVVLKPKIPAAISSNPSTMKIRFSTLDEPTTVVAALADAEDVAIDGVDWSDGMLTTPGTKGTL